MAVNSEARRAKTEIRLAKIRGDGEPMVSESSYTIDLCKALTWYQAYVEDVKLRKYLTDHYAKNSKKDASALEKATDFEVRQIAILSRLLDRDQYVAPKHLIFIESTVTALLEKYSTKKKPIAANSGKVVMTIQDRLDEQAKTHIAALDGMLDDFTETLKSEFSVKSYLITNSVTAPVARKIGARFAKTLEELEASYAKEEDQLVEAYSQFTRKDLKKVIEFVRGIVSDCSQQIQSAKATRTPRAKKPMSMAKAVGKLRFLKEFAELKLKSCSPISIMGAQELWTYETKRRRLCVYKTTGGTLSVKGTTIVGFDVKESKIQTIRNPEMFFANTTVNKRSLTSSMKSLKTKSVVPNGRTNEDTILLLSN